MRVIRLGELLSDIEGILIDFLLLHHRRQSNLVLIVSYAVEVT